MKRILLVGINAKYAHTNLAIRYLAQQVHGVAQWVEYTINQPVDGILQDLLLRDADAYCFSMYIWNAGYVEELAQALSSAGKIVLLGGPEAAFNRVAYAKQVDLVFTGEGELPFSMWTSRFIGEEDRTGIPGTCYETKDGIADIPPREQVDLDSLKQPYDLAKEDLRHRVVYYESSRGCPFSCSYCLSSVLPGLRFASAEKVKADMDAFIRAGVMRVKFVDRTFNADRVRAREIWQYLIERGGETGFHFEVAPDLLDKPTAELLKKAPKGLIQLEVGLQSTYAPTLEAISRKQDVAHAKEMIRLLGEPGNVLLHVDLIAGLPKENLEAFSRSFDDAMETRAEQVQLGFLKLLPGSRLRREAEKYGICYDEEPPYEVQYTDDITLEELDQLRRIAYLLDRTYNSGLFPVTVRRYGECFGSYFSFYAAFDEFLFQRGLDAKQLGQEELAQALVQLGESMGIEMARDVVRYDWLCRKKKPHLPLWMRDTFDQERRLFYRDWQMPNLPKSKRAWHFSHLAWFDGDIHRYAAGQALEKEKTVLLFDYLNGEIVKINGEKNDGEQ